MSDSQYSLSYFNSSFLTARVALTVSRGGSYALG